ncbi:MAG: copper amine oxidase N-terminal domain-containing protein [Armatimonadetes bacterium]|nr:copper amine oxidase N-terminal domain-containing protein [Armatimonadota bacterium]
MNKYVLVVLMVVCVLTLAVASDHVAFSVHVNKKPVASVPSSPALLADNVCVPVREFAQSMGLNLSWDSNTRTVTLSASSDAAVLRTGSRTATVKGRRIHLPEPPYIYRGRFFAPILFFNEMFDQAWYWDPLAKQFRWMPIFPRYRGEARPPQIIYGPRHFAPEKTENPPVTETGIVVGEAVRTYPSAEQPSITVRVSGKTATYRVARDAIIVRGSLTGNAVEVPLGNIRPGDRVTLRLDQDNNVISIKAQYRLVRGTVQAVAEGTVLLTSGVTLRLTPQTKVIFPDNTRASVEEISPGTSIAASVSPISTKAYVVQVLPPPVESGETGAYSAEQETGDEQIQLNTTGPLQAGDTLTVLFRAEPEGKAWFTVPGARANIPMDEIESGVYKGEYIIQSGDIVIRQPVQVTYTSPNGEVFTSVSKRLVTAQTIAGYLPRIIYPRQGQQVDSPIVVRGVAQPGSTIRVTIEFRRNIRLILPYEGVTAVATVKADNNGQWETPPMAVAAPFSDMDPDLEASFGIFTPLFRWPQEPPTVYTITATAVSTTGQEIASYSVEVTKIAGTRIGG